MKTEDGCPAFPIPSVGTGDPRDGMTRGFNGMSLRDWFAGQALNGIVANLHNWKFEGKQMTPEEVCRIAFASADAMLIERNKQ